MNWFSIRPLVNDSLAGGNGSVSGDCKAFGPAISAWMDGELTPQEVARVEAHVESCAACQQEMQSLRGCCEMLEEVDEIIMPPELQVSIRAAILSEQSAAVCSHIQPLLVSFVDGELAAADRERVAGHVDECQNCNGELVEMRRTARLVGSLPAVDPPVWLRAQVLAQTSQRPLRRPALAGMGATLLAVAGIALFFLPQSDHKTARVALLPSALHQSAIHSSLQPQSNWGGSESQGSTSSSNGAVTARDTKSKEKPAPGKNQPLKGAAGAAKITVGTDGNTLPAAVGPDALPAPPVRDNVPMTGDGVDSTPPSIPMDDMTPPAPLPVESGMPSPVRSTSHSHRAVSAPRPRRDRIQPQPDNRSIGSDNSMPGPDSLDNTVDSGSNGSSDNTTRTIVFGRLVAHDRLGSDTDMLQQEKPYAARVNRQTRLYIRERNLSGDHANGIGHSLNSKWVLKAATRGSVKL